jgi:hypothetical protein
VAERPPEDEARDDEPDARLYTSEPLEAEDGTEYVIRQQNVGRESELGGGEWPDPHTPPRSPAPGSAAPEHEPADVDRPEHERHDAGISRPRPHRDPS